MLAELIKRQVKERKDQAEKILAYCGMVDPEVVWSRASKTVLPQGADLKQDALAKGDIGGLVKMFSS